jgi:pimeloyl-ACP methyl ester carboxylesterase
VKRSVIVLSLLFFIQSLACASPPVGVRRVSGRDVHQSLTANVLSTGEPGAISLQVLDRLNLLELHGEDPDAALEALRAAALDRSDTTDLLFALAELEFDRGLDLPRVEARPHFLSAAFYSLASMAALLSGEMESAIDPRFRVAADLYNRGLTSGLITDDGRFVVRNRYRRPGLGAPMAASLERGDPQLRLPGDDHISSAVRVAATAVVVFEGGMTRLAGESVEGLLYLFTLDDATRVRVGEGYVALEYEPTAALAFGLTETQPWSFERSGFLSGDFGKNLDRGLRMLAPYDRERIPIVLVHGTASSPARWAEMVNHLQSDPEIHTGYQFWTFQYNTGNPIPFSAGLLRQSIIDLVAELDPEGDDENLNEMVVVGHSQGGLLAKLCVVDSGDVFWRQVSSAPIDELSLRPETRQTLERSLFFERLPFVKRVVFIATPHRGSFLADRWFSRFASGLISMPGEIVDSLADLVTGDDDGVLLRSLDDLPSSLDNMAGDNRFLSMLVELPIAPGVTAHSVIAVREGQEDIDSGHDGVVSVESARLDGAESELIVRSGHSTQSHPVTMGEVRRILRSGLE